MNNYGFEKFWWKVQPCHPNCTQPLQQPESAGYDLYAVEDGFIEALSRKLIPLGFKARFTIGWAGLLLDRSGMGNKGITRLAGVIDPTYPDEWKVILYNTNPSIFNYKAGDRIIQCVFVPVGVGGITYGHDLVLEQGQRTGGLGSTGV